MTIAEDCLEKNLTQKPVTTTGHSSIATSYSLATKDFKRNFAVSFYFFVSSTSAFFSESTFSFVKLGDKLITGRRNRLKYNVL